MNIDILHINIYWHGKCLFAMCFVVTLIIEQKGIMCFYCLFVCLFCFSPNLINGEGQGGLVEQLLGVLSPRLDEPLSSRVEPESGPSWTAGRGCVGLLKHDHIPPR